MGHDYRLPARLILWLSWAIMALLVWPSQVSAQESAHAKIRQSLVYLEASGLNATNGTKPVTQATGFLVSNDGFILTTYHLLSELGQVAPESVVIRANVGEKAVQLKYAAAPVNAVAELDLLLLKIPPGLEPYHPVKLGTLEDAQNAAAINTSGFPKSANYRPDSGSIGSKDTSSGYLWEVNDMPFDFGQSGSPVYTDDGVVVGVAKGQLDGSPGVNYMIPVQFSDSLLATIRLSDMQAQITSLTSRLTELEATKVDPAREQLKKAVENIDEIASNFEWSAVADGNNIRVVYRKLANTGPQVESATVYATASYRDRKGKPFNGITLRNDVNRDSEADFLTPEPFDATKRKGAVVAANLFQDTMEPLCNSNSPAEVMDRILVNVVPYLKDGIQLDQEALYIEFDPVIERSKVCGPNS